VFSRAADLVAPAIPYFGVPLVLTIVVESAVAAAFGVRDIRGAAAVVLVNAITNPILVWILVAVAASGAFAGSVAAYWALVAVLEVGVVVAEWRLLAWGASIGSGRAATLSLAMNASSFSLGILVLPAAWSLLATPAR